VLSALAYAHVKRDFDGKPLKLIHRDVSPSNILVSHAGEVKLTDFGIAKAATHNSLFYKVKGKIGYMSPEQAKSEPLDHRSDLYSLAVCMYEVLTGERLFVHAGLTTSADEIYSQPVPQISRKVPGLTPDLDVIMSRALALDPNERYQTAGELQEALTRCAHRNGLLISAPDVARELLSACGPPDQWRDDGDDDDLGYIAGQRAGTEVYDGVEDDISDELVDEDDFSPIAVPNRRAPSPLSRASLLRPKTEIGKLAKLELTSIINMIDLEAQARDAGSKPLVDLNVGPKLDSGPAMVQPSQPQSIMIDTMATVPRPMPMAPPPPMAQPMGMVRQAPMPMQPMLRQAPIPAAFRGGARKKSFIKPWMVIVAILLAAGIAAGIVALSGPDVSAHHK